MPAEERLVRLGPAERIEALPAALSQSRVVLTDGTLVQISSVYSPEKTLAAVDGETQYDHVLQHLDAAGGAIGEPVTLTGPNSSAWRLFATALEGNTVLLSWMVYYDSDIYGISGQIVTGEGTAVTPRFVVASGTDMGPTLHKAVALPGGGFFLVGSAADDSRLYGYGHAADGSPLLPVRPDPSMAEVDDADFSVALLSDGSIALAWSEDGDIFTRRFDTRGQPLNERLLVNTAIAGVQSDPVIVAQDDGSYQVCWVGPVPGAPLTRGVFAQDITLNTSPEGEARVEGEAVQGGVLSAVLAATDAEGIAPDSLTWQWFSDGRQIEGATGETYVPEQSDVLRRIFVRISYLDGEGVKETLQSAATLAVANVDDPPVGLVRIRGDRREGAQLRAEPDFTDPDGIPGYGYRYQWFRDEVAIAGATSQTWQLTEADVGHVLAVEIRFTDGFGTPGSLRSAATTTIAGLWGGLGSDVIAGTPAADSITGLSGNDWITPDSGNDTVDGGPGTDMVSFVGAALAVSVNLGSGWAHFGGVEGEGEADRLRGVENATGTAHADLMRGDDGANLLRGLGSYDWFLATPGADTFEGGDGRDMVSHVEATQGVVASLATGRGTAGLAAGHHYREVERLTGSSHADTLAGGAGENDLRGLGGNDLFLGSEGGRERFDGGAGIDTVSYGDAGTGVAASLLAGFGTGGQAARDLFTAVENLTGSAHADALAGDGGENLLQGGGGDDSLTGHGGNDRLIGGVGNDVLAGGEGRDRAEFRGRAADYSIETGADGVTTVTHASGGPDGHDRLTGIEDFVFADRTISMVLGDGYENVLNGGAGADTILGLGASDLLIGGGGNDFLDGGSGQDRAYYSGARARYLVETGADGVTRVSHLDGAEGIDRMVAVEALIFSDMVLWL